MPLAIPTIPYSASNSGRLVGQGPQPVYRPNRLLPLFKRLVLVPQKLHRILLAGHNLRQVKENASGPT